MHFLPCIRKPFNYFDIILFFMGYDMYLCYFIFPGCCGNLCVMAFVDDFLLFHQNHKLFIRGNSLQTNAIFSYHEHLILRERGGYARAILYLL